MSWSHTIKYTNNANWVIVYDISSMRGYANDLVITASMSEMSQLYLKQGHLPYRSGPHRGWKVLYYRILSFFPPNGASTIDHHYCTVRTMIKTKYEVDCYTWRCGPIGSFPIDMVADERLTTFSLASVRIRTELEDITRRHSASLVE